jgi:hypothetical protein
MIDDYAYVELDFHNDPDLVLLEGSQWGELGEKDIFRLYCFCKCFQNIKCFYMFFNPITNKKILNMQM